MIFQPCDALPVCGDLAPAPALGSAGLLLDPMFLAGRAAQRLRRRTRPHPPS